MKALIAAVDKDWGIGKEGKIPWYFSEDFKWFKEHTKDAVLIMGYNTFAEIAEKFKYPESGRLLPGRIAYVISKKTIPMSDTVKTGFYSIESAINNAKQNYPDKNIFFIGGAGIFEDAMHIVDTVYLTKINSKYDCDTFFPKEEFLEENFVLTSGNLTTNEETGINVHFWIYKKNEV